MTAVRRGNRDRLVSMSSYGTLGRPADVSGFLASLTAPAWMADGLCAQTDPELFFPEKGGATKAAKNVCVGCPVKTECLQYALDNAERFGVWGGLSERERRKLLQRGSPLPEPAPAPQPRRPGRPRKPIDHGAPAGAAAHRRRGQPPCGDCVDGERRARQERDQKRREAA